MANVKNSNDTMVDFEVAVNLMDDEIREAIHAEGIEDEQEFFEAYAKAHQDKFGEEWEMDKENPVY